MPMACAWDGDRSAAPRRRAGRCGRARWTCRSPWQTSASQTSLTQAQSSKTRSSTRSAGPGAARRTPCSRRLARSSTRSSLSTLGRLRGMRECAGGDLELDTGLEQHVELAPLPARVHAAVYALPENSSQAAHRRRARRWQRRAVSAQDWSVQVCASTTADPWRH